MGQFQNDKLCLWNSRALFAGRLPDLDFHHQAAALICVALDGSFTLALEDGKEFTCTSVLVAPQTTHALKPGGSCCAFLFFDPDNPDYDILVASEASAGAPGIRMGLAEEQQYAAAFRALLVAENDAAVAAALAKLELSAPRPAEPSRDDERIAAVVRRLVNEPGESIPIEELAASVHISPSRLAHLFKERVGVPIRMFRTWYRLKTAVTLIRDGVNLTEAALRAGFYDSAHFTNTFRDTFGLSPSVVFSAQRRIHWYIA